MLKCYSSNRWFFELSWATAFSSWNDQCFSTFEINEFNSTVVHITNKNFILNFQFVLQNLIEDMTHRHNFNAHWHFEFSESSDIFCLNCTLSIAENVLEIENCQFFSKWISQSENMKLRLNLLTHNS